MGRLNKRGIGGRGGRTGGTTQYVRGNNKPFKGTNLTVVEGMHQFISPAWYLVLFIILADWMLLIAVVWYDTKQFLGVVYNNNVL